MKLRNIVLLFTFTLGSAFAQGPKNVPVNPAGKDKLELAQVKIENTQLKAQQIQTTMAQLQQEFSAENAAYQAAIDAEKKALKLPDTAVYDPKTFSFNVPAEPVKPTTEPKK